MLIVTFNTFFLLEKNVLSTYRIRGTELLTHIHRLPSTVQDCRLSGVEKLCDFDHLLYNLFLELLALIMYINQDYPVGILRSIQS